MNGTNSSNQELDDYLNLRPQSYNNFDNESSIQYNNDGLNNTVDGVEQLCSFHSEGITKFCNLKEMPKSHCENELNKVEKPSKKKGEMLLENVSSDENIAMDSEEEGALDSDDGESCTVYSKDIGNDFDPSRYQAIPLQIIQNPSISIFEHTYKKLGSNCNEKVCKLIHCLQDLQKMNINEKWIVRAERIVQILPTTLCSIVNIPEYCHMLFSLVNLTLDFKCALEKHVSMPILIVRHLKIGLQLIGLLCQYSEDLSEHLFKHQIHSKLINLFFDKHMSLALKMDILRALDFSLNGFEPIRLFLCNRVFNEFNGYTTLLEMATVDKSSRICFLITSIIRKIEFYKMLKNVLDSKSEDNSQKCLEELTTIFVDAPILMGCPKWFLQTTFQFELTPALTQFEVYPTIYKLFDGSSLLNCITKLLNEPNCSESLEHSILKFLQTLIDCDHGLRYLGHRPKKLNELLEALSKSNTQFKSRLVYKLKVLTLIDNLSKFWESHFTMNFKLYQIASVDILHDMFLLTQSAIGKYAVVNVLTMGNNLEVILNFFKYMKQSRSKNDDLHMIYALDLLKIILENSEDVDYLKKYGAMIYNLTYGHKCYTDLTAWTFPVMKESAFFYNNISQLCKIVKNNMDYCLSSNKTLITSLRVLKYLAVPSDKKVEYFVELKYKYTTIQMFSCDMLKNLLSIVDKICNNYKQPSINVWKLTVNKNIISIIRPSMVLIRCMVTLIIQSQGNAFKDLSLIKILLKLYDLMHHVPDGSTIREDATKVTNDINKILELYVEIEIGSSMANELITWTLSSPSVFVSGLLLLCKLLPCPLPIKTKKPLDKSIIATMISSRNKWIDHLSKVSNELVELITILSSSKLLLEPLEIVCNRISNLSMSLCLLVTQSLLNVLIDTDNSYCFNNCLALLTKLCNNKECAAIKTVVLQILNEGSHNNYKKLVKKICDSITVNQQEKSFLFLQCLCDSDIIIRGSNYDENLSRNSIPNKWFFYNILRSLLSLFESHTQLSTMSLAIITCMVIIKNDYGFYQFKTVLDLFPKAFYNIFDGLLQRSKVEDNQFVNTLTCTLQLLNLCVKNDNNIRRILFLDSSQLRVYLNWSNHNKDHPIHLLKEFMLQVDSICYKDLINLIDFLDNNKESIVELIEPQLSAVDHLIPTFKDRQFNVVDLNDRIDGSLSIDFYTKAHGDLLECNIKKVQSKLSNFSIEDKINNLFKIEDSIDQPKPSVYKRHKSIKVKKYEREHTPNTTGSRRWSAQGNTLTHVHDHHHTISSRHFELPRNLLKWRNKRQTRVEYRKNRVYPRQ